MEFDVGVPPPEAFEIWTLRCATWWPSSHTICRDPAAITFEPRTGGRIVESAADGAEHEWGTILDWEPPTRLRYLWHLFFDPSEATEVEVTFTPRDRSLSGCPRTRLAPALAAGPDHQTIDEHAEHER